MFDFQKLVVYQKARDFVFDIDKLIKNNKYDRTTKDQLKRASLSIMLNLTERSSSFSRKEKKHYAVIARGSVFECVPILEYLSYTGRLNKTQNSAFFST